jgi:hypothetical protein
VWAASQAYAIGTIIRPVSDNTFYYKVSTAGTSGTTTPVWPTTELNTVSDGTVVWTAYYEPENVNGYTPLAILGNPNTGSPVPSVVLLGDSIMWGQNTASLSPWGNTDNYGFGVMALNNNFGYIDMAQSGAGVAAYNAGARIRKNILSEKCTHAITQYGVNDLRNSMALHTIQDYMRDMWASLANRGIKVYQTTITPMTDTTYVTPYNASFGLNPGNTTTYTNPYTGVTGLLSPTNCDRQVLNDWIRGMYTSYANGTPLNLTG